MRRSCLLRSVIFTAPLAFALPVQAAGVDFAREIQPILEASCIKCHGPEKKSGQLRLDARTLAFQGGVSGPVIVPGKGAESPLYTALVDPDPDERMPRKAPALTKAQIGLIRAWIDQGAVWPGGPAAAEPVVQKHWSYRKPLAAALPAVSRAGWVRNPVDAFVLARLDKEGLAPSPEANRTALIRRVSLDLIGLPPTVAEVDAFVADKRPDAYECLVDRLLASAHYGERQARMWLDLARYADSNGYEKDRLRTMWKYRDWVIRAFNQDMPFDRFTIEQIAGDMLPNPTTDQLIASGFHGNSMLNEEGGVDPAEARFQVMVDRVNTTGAVWLGTTVACAQCHNHKYDPISQKEYYGLLAFFDNTRTKDGADKFAGNEAPLEDLQIQVPTPDQEGALRKLEAEIAKREGALETQTPALDVAEAAWRSQKRTVLESWHVLSAGKTSTESAAAGRGKGALLTLQKDGSLLAQGPSPIKDSYTVAGRTTDGPIQAIRLEVLPDPSLPGQGPGRGPNGGFVLSEFKVTAAPADRSTSARPVGFSTSSADVGGPGSEVALAIDGQLDTGWAVGTASGAAHQASFGLASPVGSQGRTTVLTVTLDCKTVHPQHTLGRFRLWTSSNGDAAELKLPANIQALLLVPGGKRTAADAQALSAYYRSIAPELAPVRTEIAALRKRIADLKIPTAIVMGEKPTFERPSTFLRVRGAYTSPGARVYASVPAMLNPLGDSLPPNRLGLARWLVDRENPLTGRVMANRLWEQYFGRGIVETSEDFGAQGSAPSHPELLDWLAATLVDKGWSVKALVRLMVTSATYRQRSKVTHDALEKDPYNRFYSYAPRFRVEAEMIRDVALAVSGLLSPKIGGPSVFPVQPDGIWDNISYGVEKWQTDTGPDRYRRGLYTFMRRAAPYPMFTTFDATSREVCTLRRVRTNTPLQSLNLLNDPAFVEAARALAGRMAIEAGPDPRARATHGFRLCTARKPVAAEVDRLVALYHSERERFAKQGGAAEVLQGLSPVPSPAARDDLAAWTLVANVLLNLDETQTKE